MSPLKVMPSNISIRKYSFYNVCPEFSMGYYSHFEKLYYIRFNIVNLVFVSRLPLKFWDGKTAYHECLILAMFRMTNCNQRKDSSTNV